MRGEGQTRAGDVGCRTLLRGLACRRCCECRRCDGADAAGRSRVQEVDEVRFGESGWKDRYYSHKLHMARTDVAARRYVVAAVVDGSTACEALNPNECVYGR